MTSSLPLRLHPPSPLPPFHGLQSPSNLNLTSFQLRKLSSLSLKKSPISASSSPLNPSNWEREEIRWLREEQRWIREESRWNSECGSLLQEISELKLRIQALESQNSMQGASISETISSIASLLQALKDADSNSVQNKKIPESSSGPVPMLLETESEVKEMLIKEIRVVERGHEEDMKKTKKVKVKKASLRKGSEGEDVRAMQDALQKLGFYSGEEDMEYSSFSSGTDRAVKTWQASSGVPEDGIMTAELLERLFTELGIIGGVLKVNVDDQKRDSVAMPKKVGPNGAAVTSVTETSKIQQTDKKENGSKKAEVSQYRVFLLGENRWEDPSRLSVRDKPVGGSNTKAATTYCLACRGEGHLLCTECDGTGEANIEPQFLEWVDEEAKCPYCEGLGHTVCDVCHGKPTM